jgi:hypothetical protein
MLRSKLQQIIQEPKRAMLAVVGLSAVPFLHLLGLLLILVVTLRKGWREGLLLVVLAAVLAVLLARFVLHYSAAQILLQTVNLVVLWLLAVLLRATASWQKVLEAITVVGLIAVIFITHFYPQLVVAWSQTLTANLQQVAHDRPGLMGAIDPKDWQYWVMTFAQIATGLRVLLLLGSGLISLIMARYLQAILYNQGGLKPELYHWHLNYRVGGLITFLFIAAYIIRTPIWLSAVPVLLLPLLCTGLSLVHYLTARFKYQFIILTIFYACTLTIMPQLLFLVMLLGYLDCFINFRNYFVLKG